MQDNNTVTMCQSVPLQIINISNLEAFQEPDLPTPEVRIHCPELKSLKSLCYKLAKLGNCVLLTAKKSGTAVFEAETSIIKVQTFYQNLGFQSEGDEDAECEARLDTKKLQKAINSLLSLVNYERIILCMVQDCALVFHTRLPFDLGEFTIYLGLNIGEE